MIWSIIDVICKKKKLMVWPNSTKPQTTQDKIYIYIYIF